MQLSVIQAITFLVWAPPLEGVGLTAALQLEAGSQNEAACIQHLSAFSETECLTQESLLIRIGNAKCSNYRYTITLVEGNVSKILLSSSFCGCNLNFELFHIFDCFFRGIGQISI